jgi:hypothetical protein
VLGVSTQRITALDGVNGRTAVEADSPVIYEPMHLTPKKEATRPAGANSLQPRAKFDAFLEEFNNERLHEAVDTQLPVPRQNGPGYQLRTPCIYRKKINLRTCLAGQAVGRHWSIHPVGRRADALRAKNLFGSPVLIRLLVGGL